MAQPDQRKPMKYTELMIYGYKTFYNTWGNTDG